MIPCGILATQALHLFSSENPSPQKSEIRLNLYSLRCGDEGALGAIKSEEPLLVKHKHKMISVSGFLHGGSAEGRSVQLFPLNGVTSSDKQFLF